MLGLLGEQDGFGFCSLEVLLEKFYSLEVLLQAVKDSNQLNKMIANCHK